MKNSSIILGIKRVLSFLSKKEKLLLICATIITIFIGILSSFPVIIIGNISDIIINLGINSLSREVIFNIILVASIFLIKLSLELINRYIVENVDSHSEKRITDSLMKNIMRSDMGFINNIKTGTINGRVIRCIQAAVEMKILVFVELFPMIFTTISAVVIAIYKNYSSTGGFYVAGFICLYVPVSGIVSFIQVKHQKPIKKTIIDTKEDIDGKINEILGGLVTIRVANSHKQEVEELGNLTEIRRRFSLKHYIHKAWYNATRSLIEGIFIIVTIIFCIYYISLGMMSPGDILVYVILFTEISHPMKELNTIFNMASENALLINNLWMLYNCKIDDSFDKNKLIFSDSDIKNDGKLELSNVTYVFPTTGKKVLKNINIEVDSGQHIGIMGYSGSGKTSLARILTKIFHGYQGNIKVLGKDLAEYTRDELSHTIAYLSHEPYIFYGTIRDNIVYGNKENVSKDEIIEAAKRAEIYEDIMNMEGKFDAHVSEKGRNLSLGQRQKLGLARLMIIRPKIIILDEATSALDNISENKILKNIDDLFPEQIRISIAHRYTALESCDRIIILNKGEIIFEGSLDDVTLEKLYELHDIQRES